MVSGSSVDDFRIYINNYPSVQLYTALEQGGSPELFRGIIPSTTYEWLDSAYPDSFGRILWTVLKYDSLTDTRPQILGNIAVESPSGPI